MIVRGYDCYSMAYLMYIVVRCPTVSFRGPCFRLLHYELAILGHSVKARAIGQAVLVCSMRRLCFAAVFQPCRQRARIVQF
jgi:hypothetical protein